MSRLAIAGLLVLAAGSGQAAQAPEPGREPRLLVSARGSRTSLRVQVRGSDGVVRHHLLRESTAPVTAGASGSDASGRAMFVDWTEAGERWSAYSRDGGQSWSEAHAVDTTLRLHDGATPAGAALPASAVSLPEAAPGRVFLVQFRTISLPEWREALTDSGAEVLGYFPHNAHLVRMDPDVAARLSRLPFVQRVEVYQPAYRIEPALRDWVAAGQVEFEAVAPRRVNVLAFEWGPDAKNRIADLAQGIGARVVANPENGQRMELEVDRDQLWAVASLDDVMWIDGWAPPSDDMDLVRQDSGANWLESTHGLCGQGVRGEVMDGGIQSNHPDFDGILLHGSTGVSSHGTSTYGIVFGNGARDGDGNAQALGQLVCNSKGIFASYNSVTDRFAHTQQLKGSPYFASFQSNSWGSGLTRAYTSVSHEMDDIIWRLDIAIAQSQSNTGNQDSRPQAWAKNIISVGGIRHRNTLSTSDDAWSAGASIGPAADGRLKPDVHYWYDSIFTTTTNSGYTSSFGGTSAATPEVAGVLGLMVQMWSENVWGTNPTGGTVFERQPHASTIKALLVNNAKQYSFSGTTHDLTRTHQGWGRPNLQVARDRAGRSFVVDETKVLTVGQAASYEVDVASGESELKVTMVYPDPPGTTSATLHRINDLSLKVTSPSGTVYHGNNGLAAGNYSTAGGSPNTVDTVENVFISSPAAGRWTVEVRAAQINQDAYRATPATDAVFALVVTGARLAGGSPPPPPPSSTVFEDTFETDKGWTRNPNGTDTASTGLWERGDPEATNSGGAKQLGTTVSGVNDLVTGRLAGSSAGTHDIDGGVTSIQSPAITLPSSGTLTLSFSYYLAHATNSSSADFFRVRIAGSSGTSTVFEELGAANNDDAAWAAQSVNLSSFAGQTVRIVFEAADASGASLVEAAVDDVKVTRQ